jgi:hypothetical protein
MQTLEADLTRLVAEQVLGLDEARLVSLFPKEVEAPPPVVDPDDEPDAGKRRRSR